MESALAYAATFLVGLMVGLGVWIWFKGQWDAEASELKTQIATLAAEKKSEGEKLDWVSAAEGTLRDAFNALAGEALKSNSQAFHAEARKDLGGVVDPVKEKLKELDQHVRELEEKREGAYQSIKTQLGLLQTTHAQLQESTTSLKEALKSTTVRGRWGEIELRRIVEMAGMEKHVAFEEQASTDAGRPDMIVHLTGEGVLPVDAKVPLNSYLSAVESSDEDQRNQFLVLHAKAVRSRINDLGQKRYWDQFQPSPDFVVMFVPNEASLGAAFTADPTLLEYAIDKRVLVCSPVTLLALLRTVAFGWQQHQITENALRIAEEGRELYGRIQTFANHFQSVGGSLQKSVDAYNRAVGSFDKRLLPAAQRLQEMGVSEKALEGPEEVISVPSKPKLMESIGENRGGKNGDV